MATTTPTTKALASRLSYLGPLVNVGAGLNAVLAILFVVSTFLVFYAYIPTLRFDPPKFYDTDQFVFPIRTAQITENGRVFNFTVGSNFTIGGNTIAAVGDSVEIVEVGLSSIIRLKNRGLAEVATACPAVEIQSDGVLLDVSDGLPLGSVDVIDLPAILNTPLLLVNTTPALPFGVALQYDSDGFLTSTATPNEFQVGLVPSGTSFSSCQHVTEIEFGTGIKTVSCSSGVAPGQVGGAAQLGPDGKVLPSQLPATFNADFRGIWDALTNDPTLNNGLCGVSDHFYYFVGIPGNTVLGAVTEWLAKDAVLCDFGTFVRIEGIIEGMESYNNRTGNVTAQLGDYTAPMITVDAVTLQDISEASFVTLTSVPNLVNSAVLSGVSGEIDITGNVVSLADVPFFNGTTSILPGVLKNVVIDSKRRPISAESELLTLEQVTGTASQVLSTNTGNVILSLPPRPLPAGSQGTLPTSTVQFRSITIGAMRIFAEPPGGITPKTIPNVGDAEIVTTASNQTINGQFTVGTLATAVHNGAAIRMNVIGNANYLDFSVLPGTGAIRWPSAQPANGDRLYVASGGATYWAPLGATGNWQGFGASVSGSFNINTATPILAVRRGSGIVGFPMEVMVTIQVTRVNPTDRASILMTVPSGNVVPASAGGICMESQTGTLHYVSGYVQQTGVNTVTLSMTTRTAGSELSWLCKYTYIVAA
jgi:hypothetical protein